MPFQTVHKAKGAEADIVIVLNCNSGTHGFPSALSDDPVLDLLLSRSEDFENSEERRVFYVALTRARKVAYLVAEENFESKFVLEIEDSISMPERTASYKKCPSCGGNVVFRQNGKTKDDHAFAMYGCMNYVFGCEYTEFETINSE